MEDMRGYYAPAMYARWPQMIWVRVVQVFFFYHKPQIFEGIFQEIPLG